MPYPRMPKPPAIKYKSLGDWFRKEGFSGTRKDKLGRTHCYADGVHVPCAQSQKPASPKQSASSSKESSKPAAKKSSQQIEAETLQRANEHYSEFKNAYLKGANGNPGNGRYDENGEIQSITLNTDDWRTLFPEYHGTNAGDVHEASSTLNKKLWKEALATMKGKGNNKVAILAGGGGSGKSGVGKFVDIPQYPIQLDQVSDNVQKMMDKVVEAQASGYGVDYFFVDRPPEEAWLNGVVKRALNLREKGKIARTVPIDIAIKANVEARKAAIDVLKNHPNIPVSILDNTGRNGKSRMITNRDEAIRHLESQNYNWEETRDQMVKATQERYDRGEMDEDIARGLLDTHFKPKGGAR